MSETEKSGYEIRVGLCCHLDVLGSKERLRQVEQNPKLITRSVRQIKLLQDAIQMASKNFSHEFRENFSIVTHSFSDSHFVAFTENKPPEFTQDNTIDHSLLFLEAADYIARVLLYMMHDRCFLRGGLAMGGMVMGENFITGPPIARSVEIEQNISVFPCVTLCDSTSMGVIEMLAQVQDSYDVRWMYFVIRPDGRIIINPFFVLKYLDKDGATNCRNNIVRMLNCFQDEEHVRQKYCFLRDLWNATIENFQFSHIEKIEVLKRDREPFKFQFVSEIENM